MSRAMIGLAILLSLVSDVDVFAQSSDAFPNTAKLPDGREFGYRYDQSSGSFAVNAEDFIQVQWKDFPALNISKADCAWWEDTISSMNASTLANDAARLLSHLSKPRYDLQFRMKFMNPYLQNQVAKAVALDRSGSKDFTVLPKNGTEVEGLDVKGLLEWNRNAIAKIGNSNLVADAESRLRFTREDAPDGTIDFLVQWQNVGQWVACDLMNKSVSFTVVYRGKNNFRYRTQHSVDTSALKQVWTEMNTTEPSQNDILSVSGAMTYRDLQWALAGARLALATKNSKLDLGSPLRPKSFFALLNSMIDPAQVSVFKDFNGEVLPKMMNSNSSEKVIEISNFSGEKSL